MTSPRTQPPWDFLLTASRASLQSFELSRLGHAANLRKEIAALLDQWVDEAAAALLARWLIQQRERPSRGLEETAAGKLPSKNGHHPVSYNVFAERAHPAAVNRGPA